MNSLPSLPGTHSLTLDENDSRITLHLPGSFAPEDPYPLVLALHWGGPVTPFIGKGVLELLVEPAWRDLNAIIVAPDRTSPSWSNPEAEQQILELLDWVDGNYKISSNKRLITGYSMGGLGAWYIAARHTDSFRAAIPIAAGVPLDVVGEVFQIPVHTLISKTDEVFPADHVTEQITHLQKNNPEIEITWLDNVPHYDAEKYIPALRTLVSWIKQIWEN